jgi:hypothetical protein
MAEPLVLVGHSQSSDVEMLGGVMGLSQLLMTAVCDGSGQLLEN